MKNISIIYKISILLLIITLVPLVIMSFFIVSDLPVLKDTIENAGQSLSRETDNSFREVEEITINYSKKALDAQSEKIIRIRLLEISKQISEFLRNAETDTLILSKLPPDEQTYLNFAGTKKKAIWFDKDTYALLPVYPEISFIGTDGVERLKIRNGSIRKDFVDLNDDNNLEFKAKANPDDRVINYFKEGMKLKEGEIYVSHIEGRILNITEAHAGNKNPSGKYAHGIQRFVTPVYVDGEKTGILMLGLDSIHILEYMQHVRPLDYERLPLSDLLSGDYLAMLDNEGWLLHPKQYFSKGYDKNGELVPAISEGNFEQYNRSGLFPMHIPTSKILWGTSGDEYMKRIMNSLYVTGKGDFFSEQVIEEKTKVAIWVPITYGSEFKDRTVNMERGYGLLFASSEFPVFYQLSEDLGKITHNESDKLSFDLKETTRMITANIDESSRRILNRIPYILVLVIAMTLIFVVAVTYMIIKPLRKVTAGAKAIGEGNLDYRINITSKDEIGEMASSFNNMAYELQNKSTEMNKINQQLTGLYTIAKTISQSLALEEIFNVALSKALEVTDTEAGTLYSLDGDILRLQAFTGLSTAFKEKALTRKLGEGIPGIAAQLKKPITMDISQFPSPNLLPFVEKEGLVSFIGTPLMSKGTVVGAIGLGTSKKRVFTKDELDLLFSIGNVIGIAAENARLFKESRKNLQKLQTAFKELQTLDTMKDELISNVSHELKTPLISIKGYGELLYDEKLGELSDKQKKSLEAIIRNADRLTRLINSILFISKFQAGKVEFKFESLDIKEIIKHCVDDFKRILDEKQIQLEMELPEIIKILGDKDRFTEVITNLLDNAIKFTPQGGKISIKAQGEKECVHITVSDNGIGISPEVLPKLFSRFYQVDTSSDRKFGGTGLGLYITKNIIDALNGKIWIESEVAKGTTVHVLVPVAKEE